MSATDQFTENSRLTAIVISYSNPDVTLVADDVLPRIKVGRKYSYHVYDCFQSAFMRPIVKLPKR